MSWMESRNIFFVLFVLKGLQSPCPYARDLSSRVVGHHRARIDDEASCLVANFVHDLAGQMQRSLPEYKKLVEASPRLASVVEWENCCRDPDAAMAEGIVQPLVKLGTPRNGSLALARGCDYRLIVVDGVNEADYYRAERCSTLAEFLQKHRSAFPDWLKLVLFIDSNHLLTVKTFPFQRLK